MKVKRYLGINADAEIIVHDAQRQHTPGRSLIIRRVGVTRRQQRATGMAETPAAADPGAAGRPLHAQRSKEREPEPENLRPGRTNMHTPANGARRSRHEDQDAANG